MDINVVNFVIFFRNGEKELELGILCALFDLFFEVCEIHIKVFQKKNILTKWKYVSIVQKINLFLWFEENNECYKQRIEIKFTSPYIISEQIHMGNIKMQIIEYWKSKNRTIKLEKYF